MFDTNRLNAFCPNCGRRWIVTFNTQPATYRCQGCGHAQITLSPIMVTKAVDSPVAEGVENGSEKRGRPRKKD